MFLIGDFVMHESGKRGIVLSRREDGRYTIAWLKQDAIEKDVSADDLQMIFADRVRIPVMEA